MNVWTDDWDPRAGSEYKEAVRYYDAISYALAEDLIAEVDRSIHLILENRETAAPYRAGTRRKNLRRFPYAIIYRVHEDRHVIEVIALMHQSREPGYWQNR